MALFLSTFINKIDKKGRVTIPAPFRSTLMTDSHHQGFIAFRSYKHLAIDCCSHERMVRLSESLDTLEVFSDEQDDMAAAIFADALQISFDADGRILLPQILCDHAQVNDTIAFVGRGHTFQLWQPQTFEVMQSEARQRMKDQRVPLTLQKKATSELTS